MKSNVEAYIDYFRQLAVHHTDLQHNPLSETGDGPIGSQHFTSISVDEVAGALRSTVGWPCLLIELYETQLDVPMIYDIKERVQGAFMVLDNPADVTFAAESACYFRTEAVVNDILRKIYQDHYGFEVERCNAPFKEFYFDQVSITPVGPICVGQHGYRVVFGMQLHKKLDISTGPGPGRFLPPGYLLHQDNASLTNEASGKLPVA